MCIRVCVLGSGSKGNCIYVGFDKTHILIDAGLPIRRIERFVAAMGIAPSALSVLITHSHRDHIGSLDALTEKYSPAVYISEKSRGLMPECRNGAEESRIYFGDEDFFVGQFTVSPFAVSHDVPCVGYTLTAAGKSVSVVTDIGRMTDKVLRSLAGSALGHLSNIECAKTVCLLAAAGTKQVVLAHLSEENNCPELAFETTRSMLERRGYVEGKDIKVDVAEQNAISAMFEIS